MTGITVPDGAKLEHPGKQLLIGPGIAFPAPTG